jgi:hypothetical protein
MATDGRSSSTLDVMGNTAAATFIVLFAVQGVGTAVYLFMISRLFSRLERQHPDVYESLGSPSLFLNNNARNNALVLGWLWRKDFGDLSDPETARSAALVRRVLVMLIASFVVLIGLFIASAVVLNQHAV